MGAGDFEDARGPGRLAVGAAAVSDTGPAAAPAPMRPRPRLRRPPDGAGRVATGVLLLVLAAAWAAVSWSSAVRQVDEARSTVPPVLGDRVGRPVPPGGPITLLVVLGTFLAVVGGPPPRWGTRWFWVLYLAAPVGLVGFVSLELLTRRRLPRDGRAPSRRQGGWRGVGLGLLLGFAPALTLDVGAGCQSRVPATTRSCRRDEARVSRAKSTETTVIAAATAR